MAAATTALAGRVLVYGGRGALGATIVQHFKTQGWWVGAIDLQANDQAHGNVVVSSRTSLVEQEKEIVAGVKGLLAESKLDAILCVAGGWAGGSAAAADFIANTDLCVTQSLWSSVIAARLASLFLKDGGLLTLTGAGAAKDPTPGMIGYGMVKAAVHHLVRSLGDPKGGLPADAFALAILPVTLDTPMNRKWMPKADHTTWTPLDTGSKCLRLLVHGNAPLVTGTQNVILEGWVVVDTPV
ncbi:putative Dihydropteridine reductase [Hypsibius exemplaris]|uniref:Dihydropteridine reductase n=1 Tax=Hypsibius exemplaris TaxID=2072580 RepID=A0A1W0W969_HYPEX|nr:putative Dihydropteridine reductase [Hypsibius exemplaris]